VLSGALVGPRRDAELRRVESCLTNTVQQQRSQRVHMSWAGPGSPAAASKHERELADQTQKTPPPCASCFKARSSAPLPGGVCPGNPRASFSKLKQRAKPDNQSPPQIINISKMASLTGQPFPEDVSFQYIPYSSDKAGLNSCGLPVKYDASKGTHLTSSPGLFSVPCHEMLTPFSQNSRRRRSSWLPSPAPSPPPAPRSIFPPSSSKRMPSRPRESTRSS